MMKRLYPYCLIFVLAFALGAAHAQDTTKKAPEEKKVSEVKSIPIKPAVTATPSAVKPVYHYRHRLKPAIGPAGVVNAADTAKTVPQKTQIDPAQLTDKSLNGQYQYLLTKTYNYQQPLIAALWKNFSDTLALVRNQLKTTHAKLASQSKLADSLKAAATSKEQTLSESNARADAISLFGIQLTKSSYNLIMVGSVVALAAALFIVIGTTAKNKHEAKYRTELYEELDEEFKTFKSKAHEKELKLARELQTERNKLDELLGRG